MKLLMEEREFFLVKKKLTRWVAFQGSRAMWLLDFCSLPWMFLRPNLLLSLYAKGKLGALSIALDSFGASIIVKEIKLSPRLCVKIKNPSFYDKKDYQHKSCYFPSNLYTYYYMKCSGLMIAAEIDNMSNGNHGSLCEVKFILFHDLPPQYYHSRNFSNLTD